MNPSKEQKEILNAMLQEYEKCMKYSSNDTEFCKTLLNY